MTRKPKGALFVGIISAVDLFCALIGGILVIDAHARSQQPCVDGSEPALSRLNRERESLSAQLDGLLRQYDPAAFAASGVELARLEREIAARQREIDAVKSSAAVIRPTLPENPSGFAANVAGLQARLEHASALSARIRDKRARLAALAGELSGIRSMLNDLQAKSARLEQIVALRRQRVARLEDEVTEVQRRNACIEKLDNLLAAAREDLTRYKEILAVPPEPNPGPNLPLWPRPKGAYVVIECAKDGAVVYPGKTRISAKPTSEELEALFALVDKVGYASVLARPGSFDGPFQKVYFKLCEHVDRAQRGDKRIGTSCLPIEESEPIEPYLPKGSVK